MRLLITGAAGSGTTSLGEVLAASLGINHFDADDYFWIRTQPPYKQKQDVSERLALLMSDLCKSKSSVLSGSVVNWGTELEDSFSHIVFLTVDTVTRITRLRSREIARFGTVDQSFIEWAAQYDEGTLPDRSRRAHEDWLSTRSCPVLRIAGEISIAEGLEGVKSALPNFKCSGLPAAAADHPR